ncbi:MAG: hypothetical protein AMXMBFR13_21210 [Phycisphaerae bacterium]
MSSCGGCASAGERCGNGLEKIYPTTAVRYGRMRHIGEFSHAPDMKFTCGARVVVSTDRGIEIGEQVSLTCFGCDKSVSRDQMKSYAEASGGDAYQLKKGRILREASPADLQEWKHIEDGCFDKLQVARRASEEHNLPMKVVDCEYLFGGERIVFYFLADERVDFRDLVRSLAGEFQTRIEMRQIGARDEARLVADYETCGRECCCKNFLKTLKPVSMQMAKLQKATLDPSKVSGRCGRLKCCLRYEHETYESLDKKLPRLGLRIATMHGNGQVIDRQVLTQLVKIRTDDERLLTVVVEDILDEEPPPPSRSAEPGNGGPAQPRGRSPRREGRANRGETGRSSPRAEDRRSGRTADSTPDGPSEPTTQRPVQEPVHDTPKPQDSDPGGAHTGNEPSSESAGPAGTGDPRRRRRRRRRRGDGGHRPPSTGPQGTS